MTKIPLIELVSRCHAEGREIQQEDTAILNPFTGEELEDTWYICDRFYRGFQYDLIANMARWASRPVKNICKVGVETYTTLLTDSRPGFQVIPREPNDEELSDIVKAVIDYWYDVDSFDMKTALAVKSSRIYGIGWFYTYYDHDKQRPSVKVIHPEQVFVDPDCTVEDYDPTYVVYEYRAQLGDLKDTYPDAEWDTFDPDWKIGLPYGDEATYDRRFDNNNPAVSCAVYELWYKDPSRVEWEFDVSDDEVAKGTAPAYKGGRRIIVAGGQVLLDKANPNEHGEIPFTPVHAYPVPGRFYGFGDIHELINIQVMRNRMSQFIFDQTTRAGGGYILVGAGSGIDSDKVTNAPIQILPCRDVNQFRIERAPTPSRHVFDYISLLDYDMQDVMGSHDITQGKRSPGNPMTAQEVAILSESDRTRVRMASRWLTWAMTRVGHQVLALMAQYPDFEWMVRIAGMEPEDGEPENEVMVERLIPFEGRMIARRNEEGEFTKEMIDLDLVVTDTSTLPATQQEKTNNLSMWLQMGLLSPDEALKYNLTNIPPQIAEQILADRENLRAEAQQMEAQQAAAGMPPEGQLALPGMGGPMGPGMAPPMGGGMAPPMDLAMMGPPPNMPPEMAGAMSATPGGMTTEEMLAAIEDVAEQSGMSLEEVLTMIGLEGEV